MIEHSDLLREYSQQFNFSFEDKTETANCCNCPCCDFCDYCCECWDDFQCDLICDCCENITDCIFC
ncbi:MAG: hypothetical protein ACI4WG_07465, partial [Erysipelotrichaceae bacterium]